MKNLSRCNHERDFSWFFITRGLEQEKHINPNNILPYAIALDITMRKEAIILIGWEKWKRENEGNRSEECTRKSMKRSKIEWETSASKDQRLIKENNNKTDLETRRRRARTARQGGRRREWGERQMRSRDWEGWFASSARLFEYNGWLWLLICIGQGSCREYGLRIIEISVHSDGYFADLRSYFADPSWGRENLFISNTGGENGIQKQ